jgi:hypothetical protein
MMHGWNPDWLGRRCGGWQASGYWFENAPEFLLAGAFCVIILRFA